MSMNLAINAVSKRYDKKKSLFSKVFSEVQALDNVTMDLHDGSIFGLVGESGCGKSTLARIIVGLERPDDGEIQFCGDRVNAAHGLKKRNDIRFQLVFQNPYGSLNPRMTIYQILAEGLCIQSVAKKVIDEKVKDVLNEVNLSQSLVNKYPHALSGGERQRIALARSLIVEPHVLILDEPVSSLDVSVQGSILMMIEEIVRHRPLITLFISHDLTVVRHIADYVYILSKGKIVEKGETEAVFNSPQQEYTKILLQAAMYKYT